MRHSASMTYALLSVILVCEATREINTKITLEWVDKQCVMTVQTLFYFLRNIINPYMTMKRRSSHTSSMSSSLCLRSADDITIYCWWLHNAITQHENCDTSTWRAISNSLEIDFMHCQIEGQLCKNKFLTDSIFSQQCCHMQNLS